MIIHAEIIQIIDNIKRSLVIVLSVIRSTSVQDLRNRISLLRNVREMIHCCIDNNKRIVMILKSQAVFCVLHNLFTYENKSDMSIDEIHVTESIVVT